MYCTACGAQNTDDAKFCNQCGVRAMPLGTAGTGSLETAPPSPAAGAGPSPAAAPAPVAATPSLAVTRSEAVPVASSPAVHVTAGPAPLPPAPGMTTTSDRVSIPLVGPSRRTMVAAALAIGLGGVAVGALVAWRSVRRVPQDPVGLIGDPTPVTRVQPVAATDAGPTTATLPEPPVPDQPPRNGRGPTVASRTTPGTHAATPANTTAPTTPPAPRDPPRAGTTPAGTAPRTAGSGTTVASNHPPPANNPPGGETPPAGTDPGGPEPPPLPAGPNPDEGGVVERGPRNSSGGFTQGEATDATGTMDPGVFGFVYRHYAPQISACYSSASRGHPVAGIILVRVRIGEDGRVVRTRVLSDSTHEPGLATCVQNSMRSWRYPQPEGGEVEVDYPLRFGGE